ncbi:hypothetical protein N7532_010300 [Penicillium argentinense]|uniref:Uncharacterized protein n=1 Tax=Penicillium argentinense TaxID=1131581 RepID=A0A9W9JXI0_9EURO|nr:uncharacterized protein N7532_010300 [Penicillium argentinense]KAJ5085529.1 hypothetical protein N7532_010300 [Penicillium argentinense]
MQLASHVHMLDVFNLKKSNGSHICLVYELLGPNVLDTINTHYSGRLTVWETGEAIAKQNLIGLDVLHQQKIGNGGKSVNVLSDSHLVQTCVLATWPYTLLYMNNLSEDHFIMRLEKPEIGFVSEKDRAWNPRIHSEPSLISGAIMEVDPGDQSLYLDSHFYTPQFS